MTREESRMTEADDTSAIAKRLEDSRPAPRAAFRGDLRRHLLSADGPGHPIRRVRLSIAACSISGGLLLAVAVVGLVGAGPLAA
jgi:hypothetical protein